VRSLWQPTAAFIVFGGTAVATFVSYPLSTIRQTWGALKDAYSMRPLAIDPLLGQFFFLSQRARQRGILSLEHEVDRLGDPFFIAALGLVVDGTNPEVCRQILEIESQAQREAAERPAELLETAAGYAPTLGILGAVLGLIHVMERLAEPSTLGAGIAVAFVATVYGVGLANLVLLPLATKLRGLAREADTAREIVIEGAMALQEGLSPHLLDQKLRGFVANGASRRRRAVA
jgi:chemotaxis protein MotA